MTAGIPLSCITFPAAILLAGMFTHRFTPASVGFKWMWISGGTIAASVLFGWGAMDFSSDGVYYHQHTVALLMDGWNPYSFNQLQDCNPLWVNCYAKAIETVAQFGTENLYITSLFVLCGILRYLQLTVVMETSGNPSRTVYHDRPLQLAVTLWLVSFIILIYG